MTKNKQKTLREQLIDVQEENRLLREQIGVIMDSLVSSDTLLKKIIIEHSQMYLDISTISVILQSLCTAQETSGIVNINMQNTGSFGNNTIN